MKMLLNRSRSSSQCQMRIMGTMKSCKLWITGIQIELTLTWLPLLQILPILLMEIIITRITRILQYQMGAGDLWLRHILGISVCWGWQLCECWHSLAFVWTLVNCLASTWRRKSARYLEIQFWFWTFIKCQLVTWTCLPCSPCRGSLTTRSPCRTFSSRPLLTPGPRYHPSLIPYFSLSSVWRV